MEYLCSRKKANRTLCRAVNLCQDHLSLIGLLCLFAFSLWCWSPRIKQEACLQAFNGLLSLSQQVLPWGPLERGMDSAVPAELPIPACPGPSGWQHRACWWRHHSSPVTLATLSRERALHPFLQGHGVQQDRSQDKPAAPRSWQLPGRRDMTH